MHNVQYAYSLFKQICVDPGTCERENYWFSYLLYFLFLLILYAFLPDSSCIVNFLSFYFFSASYYTILVSKLSTTISLHIAYTLYISTLIFGLFCILHVSNFCEVSSLFEYQHIEPL
jgi:hypothetical protein